MVETPGFPEPGSRALAGIATALAVPLLLALPGCGGGEDAEAPIQPQPDTAATAGSRPEAPEPTAVPADGPQPAPSATALEDLLPAAVQPFGPFTGVELMKTPLAEIDERFKGLDGSRVEGMPGRFSAHSVRGRYEQWPDTVNEIVVSFPNDLDPRPALEKAWGEAVEGPDNSGLKVDGERFDALYWFNPEERIRARLTTRRGTTLVLSPYFPFEAFMGAEGDPRFGYEADQPILGATIEELGQAYGRHLDTTGRKSLWWPGRELDVFPMQMLYRLGPDDRVESYRYTLQYELGSKSTDPRQAVRDAFTEKLGEPEPVERQGRTLLVYPGDPPVELEDEPARHQWHVWVGER